MGWREHLKELRIVRHWLPDDKRQRLSINQGGANVHFSPAIGEALHFPLKQQRPNSLGQLQAERTREIERFFRVKIQAPMQ
jgi:hypothetical protein